MPHVIAIANHKGGVGKTTSVASIGAALAAAGHPTLLVDLDPQANLTESLLNDDRVQRTVFHALTQQRELPVVEASPNLWVAPSSLSVAGAELELAGKQGRNSVLASLLADVSRKFRYIIIDCPPSLGLLTVNALVAAQSVLIPLTAEALPFKGLMALESVIAMVRKKPNPALKLGGIFFTRWEGRKLNKMVESALRNKYGSAVFDTKIRTNIAIAEAPLSKQNILSYNASCNGSSDYISLTNEIIKHIW